jgi:hypothetical protein
MMVTSRLDLSSQCDISKEMEKAHKSICYVSKIRIPPTSSGGGNELLLQTCKFYHP